LTAALPAVSGRLYDNAKLRQWRHDAGLSRAQVWQLTGISASWLAVLEQGTSDRAPSLHVLWSLARCYGHEPAELLQVPA
jgi:transcriptional regulator with XRE-family HTH domain